MMLFYRLRTARPVSYQNRCFTDKTSAFEAAAGLMPRCNRFASEGFGSGQGLLKIGHCPGQVFLVRCK